MFHKNIKEKFFAVSACLFFAAMVISFAFAKPSFEVAPQSEPTVSAVSVAPATQDRGSGVVISATATDVSGVSYAKAEIKNAANTVVATVNLYDDGAHSDGAAGDNVYASGWTIPVSFVAGNYGIFIVASDTFGNIYQNAIANANLIVTIPACVPSKTCADYPGQCGTNLSDGCANVLNCSGNCVAPKFVALEIAKTRFVQTMAIATMAIIVPRTLAIILELAPLPALIRQLPLATTGMVVVRSDAIL